MWNGSFLRAITLARFAVGDEQLCGAVTDIKQLLIFSVYGSDQRCWKSQEKRKALKPSIALHTQNNDSVTERRRYIAIVEADRLQSYPEVTSIISPPSYDSTSD